MNQKEQDQTLDEWLERHRGLLIKVVRSFATNNDQDDLMQEVILQVWKSIPRYCNDVAESTWIYRVALYTAISWSRKESTSRRTRKELTHDPVVYQNGSSAPRIEWLYEKIAELDPIDRSLTLLWLDGFSYREMSETLGMTASNVGVRIGRIKKQLNEKLRRENIHELR